MQKMHTILKLLFNHIKTKKIMKTNFILAAGKSFKKIPTNEILKVKKVTLNAVITDSVVYSLSNFIRDIKEKTIVPIS